MCNKMHLFIEKQIDKYYSRFGIKRTLCGSIYLIEAIKLCIDDDSLLHRNITTKLYPLVAEKFEVSSIQVERAIRNLINICYNNDTLSESIIALSHTEPQNINKYYKPSNSELISLCYWKLKIKLQENGFL